MSEELNKTQIVNNFLKEVRSKLPGWLKDNKKELKEVLSELEGHLWEKSEEIAGGNEVHIHHVQQAINEIGNPRDIAAEYKKRGTPKIWISKELFPAYMKTFGILASIIIALNTVSFIVDAVTTDTKFLEILGSYLSGIWSAVLGAFLFASLIFVALSMEGYLPEDFKKSKGKSIHWEKRKKIGGLEKKWESKHPKHVKPPLRRGELLAGGIIIILIGLALITEIWTYWWDPSLVGEKMTYYLRLSGFFTLAGGSVKLVQSMLGMTNYFAQRVLMAINIVIDVAFIPFILILFVPAVMSIPIIEGLFSTNFELYSNIELGFTVVKWFSVVMTIIGVIPNINKIITLRMKFEEYFRSQEI